MEMREWGIFPHSTKGNFDGNQIKSDKISDISHGKKMFLELQINNKFITNNINQHPTFFSVTSY